MAKGAYKLNGIYTCTKCGNVIQIVEEGGGNVVCCLKALSEDQAKAKKYRTQAAPPPPPPAPVPKEDDFEVEDMDFNSEDSDFEDIGEVNEDDLNVDDLDLNVDDLDLNVDVPSSKTSSVIKAVQTVLGGRPLTDGELSQIKHEDLFSLFSSEDTPAEKKIAQIGNVQITMAYLGELQTIEIHSHPDHYETVFLVEGRGYLYLGERATRTDITSGAFFTIPKKVPHGFKNTQTSEMILLWFHTT